jgi:hypothetical protein
LADHEVSSPKEFCPCEGFPTTCPVAFEENIPVLPERRFTFIFAHATYGACVDREHETLKTFGYDFEILASFH